MMRTFFGFAALWTSLVLSLPFLLPLLPLSLPGLRKARDRYVQQVTSVWARFILLVCGVNVETRGLNRLPDEGNICFVSNHQSYFDIPIIMACIPRMIGFIAKKELRFMPFLSIWMRVLGCLFLDRKNPRQAVEIIQAGAREIEAGRAKLIFPEGTRSRGDAMGPIRAGALKLAFRSRSFVVPLTVNGSYRLYEEPGRISPGRVTLTVHEPVLTEGLSREEQHQTARRIAEVIASALPAPPPQRSEQESQRRPPGAASLLNAASPAENYSGSDSRNSQRS
jgi:1-acyl-sn-glycerol-3-phosphate acyltransferase